MSPHETTIQISEVRPERAAGEHEPRLQLNWLDKSMVQHAHPPKLILDTIAYMWSLYFFWHQELVAGLVALLGIGGIGTALAFRKDMAVLAQTRLGMFFLVSSH